MSSHANRGRDAERSFRRAFQKNAKIERASRGHDFILTFGNGRKWYVDVKRVEKSVSGGGSRTEAGRVQIDKSELKRWLALDRKSNVTAWLVVAVRVGNRFKWRRARVKDVVPLVRGKKEPYKLTMKQIESLEAFTV